MYADNVEANKVVRITNNYNKKVMAVPSAGTELTAANSNTDDRKQWWLAIPAENGNYFYLRNVASGAYMKCQSGAWTVETVEIPQPATMSFEILRTCDIKGGENFADNLNVIHIPGTSSYAHNNYTSNVISYGWSAEGSQWIVDCVQLSDEEINKIIERMDKVGEDMAKLESYQVALNNLFDDYSCTILRKDIDLENNDDYNMLPQTLRTMVDKVNSGNWDEDCGTYQWDSEHAQKYRVQLYEPYSEGSAAASLACIQAYTNMNNPTGILSNADQVLYIMVDSDVPEGATLYINGVPDENMYNSTTSGTPLKKGLNMILCYDDITHFFIYYTVNTVVNNNITSYKVTQYQPIKIHIEGGKLNGFFNYVGDRLYKPDVLKDYLYTSERALHPMYDLIGKYVILHFHLNDTPSHPGEKAQFGVKSSLDESVNPGKYKYDPADIMNDWDRMCLTQRILMGLQDKADIDSTFNRGMYSDIVGDQYAKDRYKADPGFHFSDYFNNRMMGISMPGDLYMNATSWRTAYNVSTISYVLTEFRDDGLWGPAHEYGHMNQGPINMAGTTEVSNNTFSNVATYFSAEYNGSRNDYPSAQLNEFNQGKNYIQFAGSNTTRMFWQLWCYYHGTKHNTKFYPRLFELLRKNPLTKVTKENGTHNERYDLLHFAKMCCVAAEEDLTNFFTAWGFFVPMDHVTIDDYSLYEAVLTPQDIQAVKDEIKEFGFVPNNAILFIDDRVGMNKQAGDFGSFEDYDGNGVAPAGNFTFTVDGTTVIVSNSEGNHAGYMILDNDGNLLGFSNADEFEVTSQAAQALLDGTASIKAVGSENTMVEATNTIVNGSVEDKLGVLRSLLDNVNSLLQYTDNNDAYVGFFKESFCQTLTDLRDKGMKMLESTDGDSLTVIIKDLSNEYISLKLNEDARVTIEPGATYRFMNRLYPTKTLVAGNNVCASAEFNIANNDPFNQQWILEQLDNDMYALRNLADKTYVGSIGANDTPIPLVKTPVAYSLVTFDDLIGWHAFAAAGNSLSAIHMASNGNIVKWYTTSTASNWTLKKINDENYVSLYDDLMSLLSEADNLLQQAGTTKESESYELELNDDRFYSNAPYNASDNTDKFRGWYVITDNDIETYFHSDYSGKNSVDSLDHYIRIQAPQGETFRHVTFAYTTRNAANANATKISAYRIEASTDARQWTTVYTVNSGLNTGAAQVNKSNEFTVPKGTQYIRFMVTNSPQRSGGHPIFAVAEVSVHNRTDEMMCSPYNDYPQVLPVDMENVAYALADTREAHTMCATAPVDLASQYSMLYDAYANLYEKMFGETTSVKTPSQAIGTIFSDTQTEYYDLQGVRVAHPHHGIFIKKQGSHSEKILRDN